MGLTEQIRDARFRPAKKDSEASPKSGIKRFGYVLFHNFWRLIALNCLFLAFCLPVVTIPASLCGLNRVLIKLTRDGYSFLWSDFHKEFKACLFKSLPFGLLSAFLLFDVWVAANAAVAGEELSIPALTIAFLLFLLNSLFSGYAFVFLPSLDAGGRAIAKNALVIMLSEWKADLVVLGVSVLSVFVLAGLFPYSVFLLPIWFAFAQLAVCVCVNEPMQRRIVAPYEAVNANDSPSQP